MIPIIIMSIADETERQFMIGLFMKYKHVMYKTAIKIVNEHQAAEDMVQEACLLMIRNLDKIKAIDDCRMRAYIVSIVRNTSINYVVKRDRRSNLCFLTAEDDVFDSARDAEDVDTNLIRECEIAELKAALQLLEERDQCILRMKYFDSLPDKEIAKIYDVNPNSIRSYLTKARRNLAKKLDGRIR